MNPCPQRPAIAVEDLVRSYGPVRAVDGIGFEVPAGSLFAFLGTNGAGKTTTIRCLTTLLPPDSGSVQVLGHTVGRDDDAVRRTIGVVFQTSVLDDLLTVRENIQVRATMQGVPGARAGVRIDELAELIGLQDVLGRRYGTLSGGQKRRADIARALVHEPAVLFLDEPTAGLDPQSRDALWRTISRLRAERGTTVFLTTHYMEETERADDVCIIASGRIVAHGTPAALRARYSSSALSLTPRVGSEGSLHDALLAAGPGLGIGGGDVARDGVRVRVRVPSSAAALAILDRVRGDLTDFELRHGTMDDVFLALNARDADDDTAAGAPETS